MFKLHGYLFFFTDASYFCDPLCCCTVANLPIEGLTKDYLIFSFLIHIM